MADVLRIRDWKSARPERPKPEKSARLIALIFPPRKPKLTTRAEQRAAARRARKEREKTKD